MSTVLGSIPYCNISINGNIDRIALLGQAALYRLHPSQWVDRLSNIIDYDRIGENTRKISEIFELASQLNRELSGVLNVSEVDVGFGK
jgi:hypothetical protein